MKIPIVDEDDNIICHKERSEKTKEELCRASDLWITDTEGNILLAQRSFKKAHYPGEWGPAAAGVVEEGETYESCIIRETEEEIGLKDIEPELSFKNRYHNCLAQHFKLTLPVGFNDFILQKEEVEQVKWFTKDELLKEIEENSNNYMTGLEGLIN